jgi:opacity protein-like surface antigen
MNTMMDVNNLHENNTAIAITSDRHWYVGGFLGTQLKTDGNTKIPSINAKPPLTSEPIYHKGYNLSFNVGYKFYKSFRVESEFAYQFLPMKKINNAIGFGTVTNVSDSYTKLSALFINSYYDFRLFQHWIPYVGVGIGYVAVRNTIKPSPPIPVSPDLFFTKKNINYNAVGYQGMLGLFYQLRDNVILGLKYKYFSTLEMKATGQTNLGPDGYKTKQKISNNTILFGVNYFFY